MIPRNKKNVNTVLERNEDTKRHFEAAKIKLSNCVVLAHPLPDTNLSFRVDESDFPAGAVLHQKGQRTNFNG